MEATSTKISMKHCIEYNK